MNLKKSVLLLGTALAFSASTTTANAAVNGNLTPNGKWVGGFYTDWSYWRGGASVKKIQMVAGEKPSFITYAFLSIKNSSDTAGQQSYGGMTYGSAGIQNLANGTVYNLDNKLEPNVNNQIKNYLRDYASQNDVPLLASIGGWSFASQFDEFYNDAKQAAGGGTINANNAVVKKFVQSTLEYVQANNLDGINIDWEYPGYLRGVYLGDNVAKAQGEFFTLIINELNKAFNGQHLLTVAVWSNTDSKKVTSNGSINWGDIAQKINWIDLMSFDQHGEFDAASKDGVALSQTEINDVQKAIEFYISQGVPSKKILLGIPAYARQMLVKQKSNQKNNFGYGASLRYNGVDDVFEAFKNTYYNSGKYQYAYNANPDAYYPAAGMVDFTGVYSYSCFIDLVSKGAENSYCPVSSGSLDNRGNIGTPLPQKLKLKHLTVGNDKIAWMFSNVANAVPMKFDGAPSSTYNAYPVFSFDTPVTVRYKINKLVKKLKLGGVWFWTFTDDSLHSASAAEYSLFHAAYAKLNPKKDDEPTTPDEPSEPTQPTNAPAYVEGTAYKDGDIVKGSDGNLYKCKPWPYTGWCSGASWAYAPGSGSAWTDAWDKV